MNAVPRRSERPVQAEADTHANGTLEPSPPAVPLDEPAATEPVDAPPASAPADAAFEPANSETSLVPIEPGRLLPLVQPVSQPSSDPGLYAVLGLDPAASDAEIQTTYRRRAARMLGRGSADGLRQLNVAYEVLGNPVRRAEYDRLRLSQAFATVSPTPIRPGAKVATRLTRRRRPRHAVQPRYAGLGDVAVVLSVVGLAVLAGVLLIPHLSINLTALNALQSVLPLSSTPRRAADSTTTPATPTAVPTATPLPSVAASFAGSAISVSNPTPAQNTVENVTVRLRRDGRPAADLDVWAMVQYRTTQERWPPTGTVKTDASGAATITFNIGAATPDYPVSVRVMTQADDQPLSWATTFTPH